MFDFQMRGARSVSTVGVGGGGGITLGGVAWEGLVEKESGGWVSEDG